MKRLVLAASLVLGVIPAAFGESKVGDQGPTQAPGAEAAGAQEALAALAVAVVQPAETAAR